MVFSTNVLKKRVYVEQNFEVEACPTECDVKVNRMRCVEKLLHVYRTSSVRTIAIFRYRFLNR